MNFSAAIDGFFQRLKQLEIEGACLESGRPDEASCQRFSTSVSQAWETYSQNEGIYKSEEKITSLLPRLLDVVERIRKKISLGNNLPPPISRQDKGDPIAARVQKIDEQTVRETFYNTMCELKLSKEMATRDLKDLRVKMILSALTLVEAIRHSRGHKGIVLHRGSELILETCPDNFLSLAKAIFAVKERVNDLSADEFSYLKQCLMDEPIPGVEHLKGVVQLGETVKQIATEISRQPEFQKLIVQVEQFCQEAKGEVKCDLLLDSVEPSRESLSGVDEKQVQESFYELMSLHTLTSGYVSTQALEGEEPYIYLAMTMHTLIEAVIQSKTLKGGVLLSNGKVLTLNNCPPAYVPLAKIILELKPLLTKLSEEQIKIIKLSCVDDEDVKISVDEKLKTPELMQLAKNIQSVATKISQLQSFQILFKRVRNFCLSK